MDRLDIRIFHELVHGDPNYPFQPDIRKSLGFIAKKLDVDEDTVRKRIRGFEEMGFVKGWQALINPSLLGLRIVQLWFDIPPSQSKTSVIEKLKLVHGVIVVMDCVGTGLIVYLSCEDDESLKTQLELLRRISDAKNLISAETSFGDVKGNAFSRADWEIIKVVQKDPRKSYKKIASEVGLSSRTVKRRIGRMIDGRVLFLAPKLNPAAVEGAIPVSLVVFYDSIAKKRSVDATIMSRFNDQLALAELGAKSHGFFVLFLQSASEVQAVKNWLEQQSELDRSRLDVLLNRIESFGFIDRLLEKKVAQVLTRRPERTNFRIGESDKEKKLFTTKPKEVLLNRQEKGKRQDYLHR